MRVATTPVDDPRWGAYVASHAEASPFHLPAWSSVIADCYRLKASVLAVVDAAGEILAGAPVIEAPTLSRRMRWVSLPFSDYCPLLVRDGVDAQDAASALAEHVLSVPGRSLEIRASLPDGPDRHPVTAGYRHVLDVPADPADLHPNKGHRNSRNKAMRSGLTIARGHAAADVWAFYRLQTLTRRRHGVPVQPRAFFDLMRERLLERGHGFVATASKDDEIVAAGLYLGHNGTLVAKYYASDPAQPSTGAGYLIDWEMMVAACHEGYHTLDLGRSDIGADGLRLYKSSWGATEHPLAYTHISPVEPPERGAGVGRPARFIIRHSPTWVCRGAGQILYRWTA